MTLRVTMKETIPTEGKYDEIESTVKINKFIQMVKRIQEYLQKILLVTDWGSHFSPNGPVGCPIISVGQTNEENQYITAFREIFEYQCVLHGEYREYREYTYEAKFVNDKWWSAFLQSDCYNLNKLENILNEIEAIDGRTFESCYCIAATEHKRKSAYMCNKAEMEFYIIFWNLFLIALDDSLYNDQLPVIAELASYFGFDEPMMRDWCRAVEYVFAGNKLSEDCDLECETVEGARFFLHKEE